MELFPRLRHYRLWVGKHVELLVYEQGIEPQISMFDKSARQDGTIARDAFTYNREGDVYFCPARKMLTTKGTLVNDGATLLYKASKFDCDVCDLRSKCTPLEPARNTSVISTRQHCCRVCPLRHAAISLSRPTSQAI